MLRAFALALMIVGSLSPPVLRSAAAEPAAPAFLAGGVTNIPYHDPISGRGARRDDVAPESGGFSDLERLRWLLLSLIAGALVFGLGYLYGNRRREPPPKQDWGPVETAIKTAFDDTVKEAEVWLKPEVVADLKKIFAKAQGTVGTAVKKALKI